MPTPTLLNSIPPVLLAACCVVLLSAEPARAQRARLDQYSPAELASDGFAVSRADAIDAGKVAVQLQLDYANDPLVWEVSRGDTDSETAAIVKHHLVAHPIFGYGLTDWLLLHLTVPVNVVMKGDDDFADMVGAAPADGTTLGDPSIGLRAHLVGEPEEIFQLGANLSVSAPLSRVHDDARYSGEDTASVLPELLVELDLGVIRLGANGGVRIRSARTEGNLEHGSRLVYAAGVTLPELGGSPVSLHGEIFGTTSLRDAFAREETPLEALLGGKYTADSGLVLGLAGGLGLSRGFGAPDFRVVGQIGYVPPPVRDSDGDGLLDPDDRCPTEPEDADGFEDADGCPDPDNDRDSILDVDDKCKDEPETVNRWEDEDGCPDEVPDSDGDGLDDLADACLEEPEDADGFEDDNGCPDPDNDGDGVLDVDDRCPDEPGVPEAQGCKAPEPPAKVKIEGEQIVILDKVHFALGKHKIAEVSYELLDSVAEVITEHPEIGKVRVEGHTDSRGSKQYNTRLSQRRADAVRKYLIDKGVTPERLVAEGFGPTRPVVEDAKSEEDHARNRRVEFHIIERDDSAESSEETER